jgi:hypothetical protein
MRSQYLELVPNGHAECATRYQAGKGERASVEGSFNAAAIVKDVSAVQTDHGSAITHWQQMGR